jgi:hypothetical protein
MFPLPERLRYLQPFRRKFASRPPEELNEDSGFAPLMALLSKRVRGLALAEAERLLAEDLAALREWLSEPPQESDPLHFVFGVSLAASPADLAKLIKEEAEKPPEPELCLQMELPPGAKLRPVEGAGESGRLVTLKGLWLAINALPEEAVANLADDMHRVFPGAIESEFPVRFGDVTGRKFVVKGESWRGPFKKVEYALAVPGGYVHGSISAIGKKVDEVKWDEAPFEACFHTLRVETKLPVTGS